MIKYLLEKEFKQFFRNSFLPRLMFIFPVMIMLVLPWIANMDIKNINLVVVNHDSGSASEELIRTIESSDYFILNEVTGVFEEAMEALEFGHTDAIVEIPAGFENDLLSQGSAPIQVSINAVNDTKGSLGSSYLSAIFSEFSAKYLAAGGAQAASGLAQPSVSAGVASAAGSTGDVQVAASARIVPKLNILVQNRYNPTMNYKFFMIPALMTVIMILLGGFLPALNIVGEKEKGTIEQINITPIPKSVFIFAKLIPYWIMGMIVLTLTMLLGYLVYGLYPQGGIALVYLFAMLFILAVSGFGLVVSNYAATMQQATFIMFFFVLIFMLMSGLFTPLRSMPQWAQNITVINPPRYFIEAMRAIYLKAAGFTDLIPQFFALLSFDLFFGTWAVLSYKKKD